MHIRDVKGPPQAVVVLAPDADGKLAVAGLGGGGGADVGSAREVTLQQVLAALEPLLTEAGFEARVPTKG